MRFWFSNNKRDKISSALFDLGNLTIGAFVIGQIISNKSLDIKLFIGGLLFALVIFIWAILVTPYE